MKRTIKTRLILEAPQRMGGKVVGHSRIEEGWLGFTAVKLIDMFRKEVEVAQEHGATNMLVMGHVFTCFCQGKECKVTLDRVAV